MINSTCILKRELTQINRTEDKIIFRMYTNYDHALLRITILLTLLLLLAGSGWGQTTIWTEDFTYYSNGTNTGTGSPSGVTSWTSEGYRSSYYGITVVFNQLRGRYTSYPNPDYDTWEIDAGNPIDISGYNYVSVAVDISESGSLENDDYIRVEYNVNETGWITFETNGYRNDDFTSATAIQNNLSGNTLRLRITMINDYDNEYYYADNIVVTGTDTPNYCIPITNTSSLRYISKVNFNSIDNSSVFPGSYSDYSSSVSTDIESEDTYALNVTVSFTGTTNSAYVHAWIDWNQDGDFEEAGEYYYIGNAGGGGNTNDVTVTGNISVPSGANLGNTRMRIAALNNNPPTGGSCTTNDNYGEVEDYTVNVIPACPVTAFNVTGGGSYCSGGSGVAVGLDDSETGVTYELYMDGFPTGTTESGTGSSITFDGQTVAGTYTVVGTHDEDDCEVTMNGQAIITVATPPTTTGVQICAGDACEALLAEGCVESGGVTGNAGPNNPGSVSNETGIGTVSWSNPENIQNVGTPYASATVGPGSTTNYLRGTNYGFNIPTNATIDGIIVVINRYRTASQSTPRLRDNIVSLVKNGVIQSTNKSTAAEWNYNSFATATFGGSTDTWNDSWTGADINNTDFGVVLSANNGNSSNTITGYVDYMQITVYYTIPESTTNWYTTSNGDVVIHEGASFNPVSIDFSEAERTDAGSHYTNLSNTDTPGTYTFWAACSTAPDCRTPAEFVIVGCDLHYRTIGDGSGEGSGVWTDETIWETSSDETGQPWSPAVLYPTSLVQTIKVMDGDLVAVDDDVTVDQFTIEAGGAVTVNSGITFTIADGSGDDFVMNSDDANDKSASFINNGTVNGTGTIVYNRETEKDRYYIISSPLSGQSFSNYLDETNDPYDLYYSTPDAFGITDYHEPSNNWSSWYTSSTTGSFQSGKGYLIKRNGITNPLSFTGTLNGNLTNVPVTSTGQRYGWNAVGNPYTSALKIKTASGFLEQNSGVIETNYMAVYIYDDESANDYRVINLIGYDTGWYGFGTFSDDVVQTGQGFLVNIKASEVGGSGTVTRYLNFDMGTAGMQTHNTGTTLKNAKVSWPGVTLLATAGNETRSTIVCFYTGMTKGLDVGYDAGLFSTSDFNIYTRLVEGGNNVNFTIQALPENIYSELSVPVGIDLPKGGEVTFKAAGIILPDGLYPVLEDKLLKVTTPLKTESDSYTVSFNNSTQGAGRFYLNFTNATSTDLFTQPESFKAWFATDKIILEGHAEEGTRVSVFDMSGRKLSVHRMQYANRNEIPASALSPGVYLLRIEGRKHRQEIKIPVVY